MRFSISGPLEMFWKSIDGPRPSHPLQIAPWSSIPDILPVGMVDFQGFGVRDGVELQDFGCKMLKYGSKGTLVEKFLPVRQKIDNCLISECSSSTI